ncbi:Proteasome subunit beta type-7 [Tulasnella sp. JGI-2019a]|nr:Proteasome subunit beta type-7 [Tulasnella sp. JGI-2019a]KAG8995299.1 Proteasome subunit beta type-7 [Tulasnella sp. JGI-2019a]KAG9027096.1 Proteasome subunit beta type-7 [Tulasnella sp. JGI-2019a]
MDHFPMHWGRPREQSNDLYNAYPLYGRVAPKDAFGEGVQHTRQPIVTGTSVLAIKFKDGVILAADNLASYGSLARFKDIQRLHPVGTHTVIGAGGDMSDFQHIQHDLDSLMISEFTNSDGHTLGPDEIYEYLSRVMYNRRSQMNPLWNSLLVGGFQDGKGFLGYVDLLGTTYTASTLATGYGAYIAQPLLRKAVESREHELTEAEGVKIIEESMKVLFYRDARSLNKYQVAVVTEKGVAISESRSAETEWAFADKIRGYGAQTQ